MGKGYAKAKDRWWDNSVEKVGLFVPEPPLEIDPSFAKALVLDCVQSLWNEIDVLVIVQRFGLGGEPPKTLEQLACSRNVTRERIRQIEGRALRRLRAHVEKHSPLGRCLEEAFLAFNEKGAY
jgi:hypothetical protein